MSFKETFTLMAMEAAVSETWEYDNNTTVLLIMQTNLVSLLKACIMVSDNFQHPEKIDIIGMVNGLTDTLEWMNQNMEMNKKNG